MLQLISGGILKFAPYFRRSLKMPVLGWCRGLNETPIACVAARCFTVCDGEVPVERDYTGQTQQRMHQRVNGTVPETIKKSALAFHVYYEKHPDNFDIVIRNFNFMILDCVNPRSLNRREARAIGDWGTANQCDRVK